MTLDVWADLACPWCYVGEHRLFGALAERPGLDVTPRWRPFQLQPGLPTEGLPWRAFAEQKFGGWERARHAFRHVEAAAGDEIAFDFERIAAAVNTTAAHRLILFARAHGAARQYGAEWATARALFRAYFAEGRDVGDPDVLIAITDDAGLDTDAARAWLGSDAGAAEVVASQHEARRLGIRGVPCFVFDGRHAVRGAQPTEVLVQVLDRLQAQAA